MGVFKSILLIVYFVPFGIVSGQFRIVGLLNVNDDSKASPKHQQSATAYQTNAQGRGFSIDDGLKEFLIRPKDIIRVHVIDDLNQNVPISHQSDGILMVRRKNPNAQRTAETAYKMIAITEEPQKSGKCQRILVFFFVSF